MLDWTFALKMAFMRGYVLRAGALGIDDNLPARLHSPEFLRFFQNREGFNGPEGLSAVTYASMVYGYGEGAVEKLMMRWSEFIGMQGSSSHSLQKKPRQQEVLGERELLMAMRRMPAAYLGVPAMRRFLAYYFGTKAAQDEFGSPWDNEILGEAFNAHITAEIRIDGPFPWWRKLISSQMEDEHRALVAFFRSYVLFIGEVD